MLLVRLQKDLGAGQKSPGIPDDWPAEVEEVPDGTPDPKDGRLLMKDADELATYKEGKQADYDSWLEGAQLPGAKEEKCDLIDSHTVDLIDAGYSFGGQKLSLSLAHQATLLGLHAVKDDPSFVFPVLLNNLDNTATISVKDAAEVHQLFLIAVGTYRKHKDDGTKLKDSVRTATTLDEVAAVVDAR